MLLQNEILSSPSMSTAISAAEFNATPMFAALNLTSDHSALLSKLSPLYHSPFVTNIPPIEFLSPLNDDSSNKFGSYSVDLPEAIDNFYDSAMNLTSYSKTSPTGASDTQSVWKRNMTFEDTKEQHRKSFKAASKRLSENLPVYRNRNENRMPHIKNRPDRNFLENNHIPYFKGNEEGLVLSRSSEPDRVTTPLAKMDSEVFSSGGEISQAEIPSYIFDRPIVKFTLIVLFSTVFITGLVGE